MKVAIIGNGISGITAARFLRKNSDCDIEVISSETTYFYSRTALMYIYMGHMGFKETKPYEDYFWDKNRIQLTQQHVDQIDFDNKKLNFKSGESTSYDKLILALGSKSNMFGWPGQDLPNVGGLYHFQDLENMEVHSPNIERAVIVGGGLIGIEMAEMFKSRCKEVTMVVREESYWDNVLPPEESKMVSDHILEHHIDLRLGVNLDKINDDGTGKAKSIHIKETGEEVLCQYVGLTAGVSPNVKWLSDTDLKLDKGIVVDKYLQTNIKDVYAIGDCAEIENPIEGRRSIEAVWYTGKMMGETVAYNVLGHKIKYDPGIWFNSAKFLDIEYQVYGDIPGKLPDDINTIYWEHEDHRKSIRLNYDENNVITGFNLMGIRFRHEVCDQWLSSKANIKDVVANISLAFFDPEFYKTNASGIVQAANKAMGTQISTPKNKSWDSVFSFLNN